MSAIPNRLPSNTEQSSPAEPASSWRRALWVFVPALLILLVFYRETAWSMVTIWIRSETFAHGFLIVPMSAWMIWSKRAELAAITPRPCGWALLFLTGAGLAWLVAEVSGVIALGQAALVTMLILLVWTVLGTAVVRTLLFPLAFLFFMVPAGEFLMTPLIDHTADFVVVALRVSGIPVFREGNQFTIPSGNWSVVEACSGLRYLIASITLGCLFAYLSYRTLLRRTAFIIASILVPIVANWLRAYMIVMLGHLSGNKLATGVDHIIYGWVFFGLVMLVLFWVGSFWREDLQLQKGVKQTKALEPPTMASWTRLVTIGVVGLGICLLWRPALYALEHAGTDVMPVLVSIPELRSGAGGWQAQAQSFTSWIPHYLKPRAQLSQTYMQQGQAEPVGLFVAYYSRQRQYDELVTYNNQIVMISDKQWSMAYPGEPSLQLPEKTLKVNEVQVRGNAERLLVWRWYWIGGRVTDSDYVAKALIALNMLTGRGDDSAVVLLYTPVDEYHSDEARRRLQNFLIAAAPVIETRLVTATEAKSE